MALHSGKILALGAINGFAATFLAALGSHGLASHIDADGKPLFTLATNFHFFHALAICLTAFLPTLFANSHKVSKPTLFFQIGILGFSGTLYWRAIMGAGSLGSFHWLTPLGGLSLLAGWLMLALYGFKASKGSE